MLKKEMEEKIKKKWREGLTSIGYNFLMFQETLSQLWFLGVVNPVPLFIKNNSFGQTCVQTPVEIERRKERPEEG